MVEQLSDGSGTAIPPLSDSCSSLVEQLIDSGSIGLSGVWFQKIFGVVELFRQVMGKLSLLIAGKSPVVFSREIPVKKG